MVYGNTMFCFLSIEHFITGLISLRFMIRLNNAFINIVFVTQGDDFH